MSALAVVTLLSYRPLDSEGHVAVLQQQVIFGLPAANPPIGPLEGGTLDGAIGDHEKPRLRRPQLFIAEPRPYLNL
ncbi:MULTISPECIES: hypothetical protein [Sphingomonadales]|uniref:Uncharacterized protein n=1 Tax=Tsuneonella suprasediminis TaxID=2306996 RepID=A0A419R4B2_9SPHN|nr:MULTISPECIES: hypothetical protein [Sphingomonadales]RJX69456.1 hypothetical protein D6858_03570 [Tsuneonella suprasediminis]|tara:strand:- start:1160 stop:1387 length:228 start_codon:yes stop_codon:yes gene_type:complete